MLLPLENTFFQDAFNAADSFLQIKYLLLRDSLQSLPPIPAHPSIVASIMIIIFIVM